MKIFRDLSHIPERYRRAVITLGNFDGLHLGHRAIIERAQKIAAQQKAPLALMTFEPHPREFFSSPSPPGRRRGDGTSPNSDLNEGEGVKNGLRIYNLHSKLAVIKSLGIECVFLIRFDEKFAGLSADDFIEEILVGKLRASHVVTGENFHFGKARAGDKNLLAAKAAALGFGYTACPQVADGQGNIISSSRIRALLKEGDVEAAGALLGRPYHISGRVRHGEKRGRQLGFPTANIALDKLSLSAYGVYAVRIRGGDGKEFGGIANLGVKPSFGVNAPLLEVHLFGLQRDIYGEKLCVEFLKFLRPEQKFASLDELKKQIAIDCEKAEKYGK